MCACYVHGRNHACNLWRPVNTAYFGQNFIRYLGPLTWNSIPSALRNVESFVEFKSLVKKLETIKLPLRGFVTLWKSMENSMLFHFFWKNLEASGNIWIWDDFELSFLKKSGKCLCPKVKHFNFKEKLFPQLSTCCFTCCSDLYPLFLSFNDN